MDFGEVSPGKAELNNTRHMDRVAQIGATLDSWTTDQC